MKRTLHFIALLTALLGLLCATACSGGDDGKDPSPEPEPEPTPSTEVNYYRQLLCMQFTSTGCVNCPTMSSLLKTVTAEQPGRLSIAAFHMHYSGYADPMHLAITQTYISKLKITGLPAGIIDIRDDTRFTSEKATLDKAIADEVASHPAVCGVAVESSYDSSTREVSVTAKVTSNEARAYRYLILLVEDNIVASQYGSDEAQYVHNNVVRTLLSNNVYGERLNLGKELTPGTEATSTRTATLSASWKADDMRVIVAALVSEDNGVTWVCNNVRECKLGQSAGYRILDDK